MLSLWHPQGLEYIAVFPGSAREAFAKIEILLSPLPAQPTSLWCWGRGRHISNGWTDALQIYKAWGQRSKSIRRHQVVNEQTLLAMTFNTHWTVYSSLWERVRKKQSEICMEATMLFHKTYTWVYALIYIAKTPTTKPRQFWNTFHLLWLLIRVDFIFFNSKNTCFGW